MDDSSLFSLGVDFFSFFLLRMDSFILGNMGAGGYKKRLKITFSNIIFIVVLKVNLFISGTWKREYAPSLLFR